MLSIFYFHILKKAPIDIVSLEKWSHLDFLTHYLPNNQIYYTLFLNYKNLFL